MNGKTTPRYITIFDAVFKLCGGGTIAGELPIPFRRLAHPSLHHQPQALGHHLRSLEFVMFGERIRLLQQAALDAHGNDLRAFADPGPTSEIGAAVLGAVGRRQRLAGEAPPSPGPIVLGRRFGQLLGGQPIAGFARDIICSQNL